MDTPAIEKSYSYLVSGDSISRGVVYDEERAQYAVLEANYVALVEARLKGLVRNISRFGNTLARGLGKLGRDIASDKPDVVLLEYGGNDCDFDWAGIAASPDAPHGPATELALFEKTLTETVEGLAGQSIVPVLMTLPPLEADRYLKWVSKGDEEAESRILKWLGGSATRIYWWQERYSAAVLRVAAKTRTRWIDVRGAFLALPDFTSLICRDGIHPNEAGHRVMAEAVFAYLRDNFAQLLAEGPQPEPA